jgi:hypothetical protein
MGSARFQRAVLGILAEHSELFGKMPKRARWKRALPKARELGQGQIRINFLRHARLESML